MKLWLASSLTVLLIGAALFFTFRPAKDDDGRIPVRIGHFPNVTHAQALVAHNLSRQGKGWFEERLGPGVKVEWYVYNAGPSATSAIFARSIDLTYIGPSPAINAYARSKGEEVRIVSGAANAGAALVIAKDSQIKDAAGFRGKRLATPQLGNTQDVAARAWLKAGGLTVTLTGGDAHVVPTANPEQLSMLASNRVEGVWTVEPWVSRLIREVGAKVLVDQTDAVTTVLVSTAAFREEHPELLRKIVAAHHELTDWIIANPEEAQKLVVAEIEAITQSKVNPELIAAAWPRIVFTNTLDIKSIQTFVKDAQEVGFLPKMPPIEGLIAKP